MSFQISIPIDDAPWYLLATGSLHESAVAAALEAVDAAASIGTHRPVLDLTVADRVDTAALTRLGALVEQGRMNLLIQCERVVAMLPPRLAVVFGESRIEASEALLAHVKDRRERGMTDGPDISLALGRLREFESA